MSSSPALPEPIDGQQRDEDARYYRAILHELIEIGADLARAIHRQATAAPAAPHEPTAAPGPAGQPTPAASPDLAVAFDRVARAIRRTVALARRIADEPAPTAAEGAQHRRLAARKRIIREVEDAIQREAADGPEAEARADALHAEFYERLETTDLDDDIETLPIADIIAAIRRDLGVAAPYPGTHPWKRRTPRDLRDLCARAARPTGTPRPAPLARTRTASGITLGTGPPALWPGVA